MNRFGLRTPAGTAVIAACGLAVAVALTGCSAGQISQTAVQQAAVNGANAAKGTLTLRNVHLRANQTTDFVQPGSEAELLFVASNDSAEDPDKLQSITSDIGTVALTGDGTVPPNGVLIVGTPDGQIAPLESVERADASEAKLRLSKPISNGLTYTFTFTFEKAGPIDVGVPISAGESPRRNMAPEGEDTGGGH